MRNEGSFIFLQTEMGEYIQKVEYPLSSAEAPLRKVSAANLCGGKRGMPISQSEIDKSTVSLQTKRPNSNGSRGTEPIEHNT